MLKDFVATPPEAATAFPDRQVLRAPHMTAMVDIERLHVINRHATLEVCAAGAEGTCSDRHAAAQKAKYTSWHLKENGRRRRCEAMEKDANRSLRGTNSCSRPVMAALAAVRAAAEPYLPPI
jgi:hypothetical protein